MLTGSPIIAVLPATDLDRARKFYEDKLGLRVLRYDPGDQGILFECGGGSRMYMYQRAEPTKAEHTVAMFEVEDVERAVDDLSANGVTFEQYDLPGLQTNEKGIVEMEGERTAWFKDPEGNIVALGQMVERGREAGR